MTNIEKLRIEVTALKSLLDDPQPGLTTWRSSLLTKINAVGEHASNKVLSGLIEGLDIEVIAEAVHKSYCGCYQRKHGKSYWTNGDYSLLDEETKEIDRETVRAVLSEMTGAL